MALSENLGKKVRLMIVKEVEFGVYLGNSQEKVLLPKKQVPRGLQPDRLRRAEKCGLERTNGRACGRKRR